VRTLGHVARRVIGTKYDKRPAWLSVPGAPIGGYMGPFCSGGPDLLDRHGVVAELEPRCLVEEADDLQRQVTERKDRLIGLVSRWGHRALVIDRDIADAHVDLAAPGQKPDPGIIGRHAGISNGLAMFGWHVVAKLGRARDQRQTLSSRPKVRACAAAPDRALERARAP
jgi:hypothetical protein